MWDDPFGGDGEGEDLAFLAGEDENEQDDSELFFANKDCIIFLIDCQRAMFAPNERGEVPFKNALKCAVATLTDKIISSENDLVGICLYGTEQKKNPNDFENIYVLQDLDVPDAQRIMELETHMRSDDFTLFGHTGSDFPFCDALWTCSTMFSNCSVKVGHKRIFLFTNDDNPNANNKNLREQSFQRAKDLAELGIDIELFSMNKPDQIFDPSLFFQYIISVSEDEDTGTFNYDPSSKFEELRARVRRKEFKKRAITRLPLILGPNIEISVRVYNLVQSTKKGTFTWLDARTNQPIKTMTKWVCNDTGQLLMDSQIKYSHDYGGQQVIFDKEEVTVVKTFDKKGIRLIGFKPRSTLKNYYNLKHSSFIYPDETQIQGSTVAFAALLDRMLLREKLAIARWTPRDHAPPRFVALLPQAEAVDEDGLQTNPPGLHVIPLPYADDVRNLNFEQCPEATPEQILKAKKLVKTLRINFDSRSFENPSLQKHYASLQALALDRDTVEATPDYLQPDEEGMEAYGNLIEEFKESVFSPDYVPVVLKAARAPRRKREEGEDDAPRKKAVVEVDDPEVRDLAEAGNLSKLTIPQLKAFLQRHDVKAPSQTRKPQLIEMVCEVLESEGPSEMKTEVKEEADAEEEEGEDATNSKKAGKSSSSSGGSNSQSRVKRDEDNDETAAPDDDDF